LAPAVGAAQFCRPSKGPARPISASKNTCPPETAARRCKCDVESGTAQAPKWRPGPCTPPEEGNARVARKTSFGSVKFRRSMGRELSLGSHLPTAPDAVLAALTDTATGRPLPGLRGKPQIIFARTGLHPVPYLPFLPWGFFQHLFDNSYGIGRTLFSRQVRPAILTIRAGLLQL